MSPASGERPNEPGFADERTGAAEELAEALESGSDDIAFLEESQDSSTSAVGVTEDLSGPDGGEPTFADEAPGTGKILVPRGPPRSSGRLRPGPPPPSGKPPTPGSASQRLKVPSGRTPAQGPPPPGPSGSGLHKKPGPGPSGSSGSIPRMRATPPAGTTPAGASDSQRAVRPGGSASGRSPAGASGRFSGRPSSSSHDLARQRPSGSGAAKTFRPGSVPERSEAEDQAAIAELRARAQPAPAGDPWLGRDLGPFRIEEFIELERGERRYLALHDESKLMALVRVFPLSGAYADEFKRLADRGERGSRVESAHLSHCLGAGRTKECFFAGFRPPLGPTLAQLMAAGPLPEKEVIQVLEQVGRGIAALHARDMAHGHLSPETIRRERPGCYVAWEAGLARPRPALVFLSSGGDVLGTPGYIAPETVDSGQQNKASDLYSLGCTAWALLSQRPPFTGDDEVQTLLDQLNLEVPPVAGTPKQPAPEKLSIVVGKLTGYTTDVRYGAASEMIADLKLIEKGDQPARFPPAIRPDELIKGTGQLKNNFIYLLVVLLLVNVGALTLVVTTWFQARSIEVEDPLQGFTITVPEAPR